MNVSPEPDLPLPSEHFKRAGILTIAATVVFLFAVGLVFRDLTHSNRPHELTMAPWVALLLLANAVLCYRILRRLWSGWQVRETNPPTIWHYLLFVFDLGLTAVNLFLFLGAAGTVPAVLGWE